MLGYVPKTFKLVKQIVDAADESTRKKLVGQFLQSKANVVLCLYNPSLCVMTPPPILDFVWFITGITAISLAVFKGYKTTIVQRMTQSTKDFFKGLVQDIKALATFSGQHFSNRLKRLSDLEIKREIRRRRRFVNDEHKRLEAEASKGVVQKTTEWVTDKVVKLGSFAWLSAQWTSLIGGIEVPILPNIPFVTSGLRVRATVTSAVAAAVQFIYVMARKWINQLFTREILGQGAYDPFYIRFPNKIIRAYYYWVSEMFHRGIVQKEKNTKSFREAKAALFNAKLLLGVIRKTDISIEDLGILERFSTAKRSEEYVEEIKRVIEEALVEAGAKEDVLQKVKNIERVEDMIQNARGHLENLGWTTQQKRNFSLEIESLLPLIEKKDTATRKLNAKKRRKDALLKVGYSEAAVDALMGEDRSIQMQAYINKVKEALKRSRKPFTMDLLRREFFNAERIFSRLLEFAYMMQTAYKNSSEVSKWVVFTIRIQEKYEKDNKLIKPKGHKYFQKVPTPWKRYETNRDKCLTKQKQVLKDVPNLFYDLYYNDVGQLEERMAVYKEIIKQDPPINAFKAPEERFVSVSDLRERKEVFLRSAELILQSIKYLRYIVRLMCGVYYEAKKCMEKLDDCRIMWENDEVDNKEVREIMGTPFKRSKRRQKNIEYFGETNYMSCVAKHVGVGGDGGSANRLKNYYTCQHSYSRMTNALTHFLCLYTKVLNNLAEDTTFFDLPGTTRQEKERKKKDILRMNKRLRLVYAGDDTCSNAIAPEVMEFTENDLEYVNYCFSSTMDEQGEYVGHYRVFRNKYDEGISVLSRPNLEQEFKGVFKVQRNPDKYDPKWLIELKSEFPDTPSETRSARESRPPKIQQKMQSDSLTRSSRANPKTTLEDIRAIASARAPFSQLQAIVEPSSTVADLSAGRLRRQSSREKEEKKYDHPRDSASSPGSDDDSDQD